MDNPLETPIEMIQRLTNHLSIIARRLTEQNDLLKSLVPLIKIALIVWIATPIVLSLMLMIFMMNFPR